MMIILILAVLAVKGHATAISKPAKELKDKITKDYDSNVLPSEQMKVEVSLFSVKNFRMDEKFHSAIITCGMTMLWTDPSLTWTPSEHNGIAELGFRPWRIWSPDIQLSNAKGSWAQNVWVYDPIKVTSEGKVTYAFAEDFRFSCAFDMTYWPFDTHNCSMIIKSWNHGTENLEFDVTAEPKTDLAQMRSSTGEDMSDWVISDISISKNKKRYPCCDSPFTEIVFSMTFTRKAPAYMWTAKVPLICLCLLTMLVFLLPPDAGEKFVLGGLTLLFNVFLILVYDTIISASPSHTPLLVLMTSQQLVLTSLSMIVSTIVFRISKSPHTTGIPAFLKGPVLGISNLLLLGNYTESVSSSHKSFSWTLQGDQVELADDSPAAIRAREKYEWVLLGALVDRVVLLFYMTICLISFIRFSSVL